MKVILFAKSHFSIGESLLTPADIAIEADRLGYEAACLCDTMTVSGMIEFTNKAVKLGVKPIIGVRLRIVNDVEVRGAEGKAQNKDAWYPKLIVRTEAGFKQVLALLSLANTDERYYYAPRLLLSDVLDAVTTDDVYVATGDALSAIHARALSSIDDDGMRALTRAQTLVEIVPSDTPYYDAINQRALRFADMGSLATLVTLPCLYREGRADTLDVLGAIAGNSKMSDMWTRTPFSRDQHPQTKAHLVHACVEAKGRLAKRYATKRGDLIAKGIEKHGEIIDGVEYVWEKHGPSLPKMAEDEYQALVEACQAGWSQRFTAPVFGHVPDTIELIEVYKPRLRYELDVLKRMGFCGYFLLVQDIVKWAKSNGIVVGPGRGSVGGSLIAYLMGITDVDPIRFGLIFERFINPDRIDLPDADLDFMSERRAEVIEYIENKWGVDYVAGISNYSTLASASALRDVGRVHEISDRDLSCSKLVPKPHGKPLDLDAAAREVPEISTFKDLYPGIWKHAQRLEGTMRSMGRHAAGIVVAGVPLIERAVVEKRTGARTINWDKRIVEDQGLVKLDVLGLSTLDTLDLATHLIFERRGTKIDLTALPLDDPQTIEGFKQGDTIGIFQFESSGMRKLLQDLGEFSDLVFLDIAAATALYRPGPMDSGLMDQYVAIKQGIGAVVYDHLNLEDALEETYGVIVYQEQVMQAARDLAGFTMTESDKLRKAMGKKLPEEMAKFRDAWIDGCLETSGMDKDSSETLFDKIEAFAGYGFNKSHAVEYSLISYQAMWLKQHYSAEFYAAALTIMVNSSKQDRDAKMKSLLKDAGARGITVSPPDINVSTRRFELLTDTLLAMPFTAIKGVSDNTTNAILKAREEGDFESMEQFVARVERRRCNVRHQRNLDLVGAFSRIEKGQPPALDESRLKDQMELLPGLMIKVPKAEREISPAPDVKRRLVEVIKEYRGEGGEYLPRVAIGKTPKFMVVTDAPTWAEVKSGQISKGATFAQVSEALYINGLSKQMGYFTCLSKEQKEGDRLDNDLIKRYAPTLTREIDILKPPVIVALGSATARHFVKGMKGSIVDNCGNVVFDPTMDANIVVGISPGMVYMDPAKQGLLNEVFAQVKDMLD